MSKASEIYTVVAALKKAEETMNLKKDWKHKNDTQKRFLKNFLRVCREDNIEEIELEVSDKVEIINAFLEKKGFSIRLQDFLPGTLGFASILDLLIEWVYPGEKVKIDAKNGRVYEGVRIGKDGVSFFESTLRGHTYTIACIRTKSDDIVFITVPDVDMVGGKGIEGLDLIEMAGALSDNMDVLPGVYEGVRFPMVDLDITNNIGWLKGMSTVDGMKTPAEITHAIQQIKIKMNEKGARFQSATAMGIMLMCANVPKPDLVIREPFLVWVGRYDIEKPIMVAFVTEEDWKNPGKLK